MKIGDTDGGGWEEICTGFLTGIWWDEGGNLMIIKCIFYNRVIYLQKIQLS